MAEATSYSLSRYLSSPYWESSSTPSAALGRSPSQTPPFAWDLPAISLPYFPVFRYVSRRLAEKKLYLALIITDNGSVCLPAWPISNVAQDAFVRIARKAYCKFSHIPSWLRSIAESSIARRSKSRLVAASSDSYLIRRSIIQHEIIYSSEGLALLTVDHVYTFKNLLIETERSLLQTNATYTEFSIHVYLLRRINSIYTGRKPSVAYIKRAYDALFDESTLKKVCRLYSLTFHEPGLQGLNPDLDKGLPPLPELDSPSVDACRHEVFELESPSVDKPGYGEMITQLVNSQTGKTQHEGGIFELHSPLTTVQMPDFIQKLESNSFSNTDDQASRRVDETRVIAYPEVPLLSRFPKAPPRPPLITPSNSVDIRRTICSRCLAEIEKPQSVHCNQEMTMLLSPEWESFRKIGLGILKA
ncbi:MAG: hypothetical protein Q9190_007945 [Brigantiaea leucoxantha]